MVKLFGAKLRALRRRHHLTQADLAYLLAIASQAHVSNLEHGHRMPSLDLVVTATLQFGVSTDDLILDSISVEQFSQTLPEGDFGPDKLQELRTLAARFNARGPSPPVALYFGRKLRSLRRRRKIKQADLAQRLNLQTQSSLSHLERGRKEPSLELVLRAAEEFGVTIDYLLLDSIPIESVENDSPVWKRWSDS